MVTGILRRRFNVVELMKKILNFALALEKKYKERFVAIHIIHIVNYMIGCDFVAGMSTQSYHRHIQVAMMILRHDGVFDIAENLNGDDGGSKSLGMFHFDGVDIYRVKTVKLLIVIILASNFVKRLIKLVLFHQSTF